MDSSDVNVFLECLESAPGWMAGNVLDLRPEATFRDTHLKGAASHPLEESRVGKTETHYLESVLPSIFLPPRHEPLLVIAHDTAAAGIIAEELRGRGRTRVTGLALPADLAAALPAELRSSGTSPRCLWKPPAWLERHQDLLPPPAAGAVLDLACGSGRAVVWLAEKGYRVTGIDWQVEALDLGRKLASSRGISCRFLRGDLRDLDAVPPGPWSVILNFRFRQHELLETMADRLQPGGVALVRTFRAAPGYEGHPSARHRLGAGELLRYFPAGSCEVLAHEESHDPDGRPAAGIVARRKAG